MKEKRPFKHLIFIPTLFFSVAFLFFACTTRGAIRAEEYFSIGMAFYELGNFVEAERWLNRARAADRTMVASEYNLGRIAFETGRFEEAAGYFERILRRDPENVMALRGAAYSRIHNGDMEIAEQHYERVLSLIPESADDGFNHALVLFSMEKYEESGNVLNRYQHSFDENPAIVLLLARNQKAQDKVEAVDSYARWLELTDEISSIGLFEYAHVLENAGFYARSLEVFNESLNTHVLDSERLSRATIRFNIARLYMIADPDNPGALSELEAAVLDGFSDTASLELLQRDERITSAHRDEIRRLLTQLTAESEQEDT